MEQTSDLIRRYLQAFFSERALTAETLRAGEEHYTKPAKRALKGAGRASDEESLSDSTAQELKSSVRTALAICGEGPNEAERGVLELICALLTLADDDIGDAFAIAIALLSLPALGGVQPTPLACSVVAFSLFRLGVRRVCSKKVGSK